MQKNPPQYLVIAAVLFTSSSSIFIRLLVMPPLVIAFYRMVMSAAFLAVPLLLKKENLRTVGRRDILLCVLSGLALALHFATWIASLSMTTVMASTVLVSSGPFFVALFNAVIFRKKPGKVLILCLLAAFAGTLIITTGSGGDAQATLLGNMLALAGAVTVSFYLIIGQEVRKRVSTAAYSFLVYAAAAVFLLIMCLVLTQPLAQYTAADFAIIAAMAVVCSVFGHTLYNMLLKFHGAFLVSLATLCEPLLASLLAMFILSEIPAVQTIFGGMVVMVSIATYIIKNEKTKSPIN